MTSYQGMSGVPDFTCTELSARCADYCVLIPVINEGERIRRELRRAFEAGVPACADIVICDGGSSDGSLGEDFLRSVGVNSLLVKTGPGKQGAQLRMGFRWALDRGYRGFITVDGNDKDSIEDVPAFIRKLEEGYDLVQGSRFVAGGEAVNTPPIRFLAVRLLHAPVISLTAGRHFTDTTNAYRAYSRAYLTHPDVQPFRDIFSGYELLAYLSVRATQLGLKACEIPVRRAYAAGEKPATKISPLKGNLNLLRILLANAEGTYNPDGRPAGPAAVLIQFVKFALVGLSNTVVLLAVYYLTLGLLGQDRYLLGQSLGYAAGIVNSYFWNSRFVFRNRTSPAASFAKMVLSYGATWLLQAGLLYLFVECLGISEALAPVPAILITTPVNFLLNKLFAFASSGTGAKKGEK